MFGESWAKLIWNVFCRFLGSRPIPPPVRSRPTSPPQTGGCGCSWPVRPTPCWPYPQRRSGRGSRADACRCARGTSRAAVRLCGDIFRTVRQLYGCAGTTLACGRLWEGVAPAALTGGDRVVGGWFRVLFWNLGLSSVWPWMVFHRPVLMVGTGRPVPAHAPTLMVLKACAPIPVPS